LIEKFLSSAVLVAAVTVLSSSAHAEVSFGSDLVSRYVWRGTDFGDAVSVQPGIAYSTGAIEIGAWSSWALSGAGANENDIYVSFAAGPVGITITDYFFPTGVVNDFFNYKDEDGIHILEVSASYETGPVNLMGAFNFLGDGEDSFYLEAGYGLGEMDGIEVGLTAGLGNGAYTTDTDPMLVNLSINLSKDDYFASYILNPDKETTFLIFGKSF